MTAESNESRWTIDARRRFSDLRFALKEVPNGVEEVIDSLAYLRKTHPGKAPIETALRYFRKHRHRMSYKEYEDQGLPIGSGVVEAACKTLVTQRMKQSGMRWGEEGGQALPGRGHHVAQCAPVPGPPGAKASTKGGKMRAIPSYTLTIDYWNILLGNGK